MLQGSNYPTWDEQLIMQTIVNNNKKRNTAKQTGQRVKIVMKEIRYKRHRKTGKNIKNVQSPKAFA